MADDCVCVDDPDEWCGATRPPSEGTIAYVCTREPGHDGKHVTCAVPQDLHRIAEWDEAEAWHVVCRDCTAEQVLDSEREALGAAHEHATSNRTHETAVGRVC